jgi:hypothetical protein
MDNQTSKAPVPQSDVINSGDYERGLEVLARIIARAHIKKMANKLGDKDEFLRNKV